MFFRNEMKQDKLIDPELLTIVLSFLDNKNLYTSMLVNKVWHDLIVKHIRDQRAAEYIENGKQVMKLIHSRFSKNENALKKYFIKTDNTIKHDIHLAPLLANNMHAFLKKTANKNIKEYTQQVLPGAISRGISQTTLFILIALFFPILIILLGPVRETIMENNEGPHDSMISLTFLNRILSDIIAYDYGRPQKMNNFDYVKHWSLIIFTLSPLLGLLSGLQRTIKNNQEELSNQYQQLLNSGSDNNNFSQKLRQ